MTGWCSGFEVPAVCELRVLVQIAEVVHRDRLDPGRL